MDINLNVKLESKDYKDYSVHCNQKRVIIISIIYFLVLHIAIIGLELKDGYSLEGIKWLIIFTSFVGIIGIAILVILQHLIIINRSKNIFNNDTLIKETHKYLINDEGVNSSSDSGNLKLEWGKVFKVRESKRSYFIFVGKNRAVIIPKRFFESKEVVFEFRKKILNNVDSSKVKLKKY